MCSVTNKTMNLNQEEWDELVALKNAINHCPAQVHYDKMERFTELMVRTLYGKGDMPPK
jgi:thioester reductase-like protein